MNTIGQRERETQKRVVELFQNNLGYAYLGNWEDRLGNSNIEEDIVRKYLSQKGYSEILIGKALDKLRITANNYNESLYTNNKNLYGLLRYGVKVKADVGENYETVELIDWKHPLKNQFAIAEEVTVQGNREKRPDIVLYVNGIALGMAGTETKHGFHWRRHPAEHRKPAKGIYSILLFYHSICVCRK